MSEQSVFNQNYFDSAWGKHWINENTNINNKNINYSNSVYSLFVFQNQEYKTYMSFHEATL